MDHVKVAADGIDFFEILPSKIKKEFMGIYKKLLRFNSITDKESIGELVEDPHDIFMFFGLFKEKIQNHLDELDKKNQSKKSINIKAEDLRKIRDEDIIKKEIEKEINDFIEENPSCFTSQIAKHILKLHPEAEFDIVGYVLNCLIKLEKSGEIKTIKEDKQK